MQTLFSLLVLASLLAAEPPCKSSQVGVAALSAAPSPSGQTPEERKKSQSEVVLKMLEEAPKDSRLLVLPEAVLTPLPPGDAKDFSGKAQAKLYAMDVPGPNRIPTAEPLSKFADAAFDHKAFIQVGMIEKEGDNLYNTVVVLGPDRRIRAKHRKANLSLAEGSAESKYVTPGLHRPTTFDGSTFGLGTVGVGICADIYDSTSEPHLMEKYRTGNIDTFALSAEWQEAADSEEGPTKGWPPEKFFTEVTQYLNHTEPIPAEKRYTSKKEQRADRFIYVVTSNMNELAPWSGVIGPDGNPVSSRKDTGWVHACIPRVTKTGENPPKGNH